MADESKMGNPKTQMEGDTLDDGINVGREEVADLTKLTTTAPDAKKSKNAWISKRHKRKIRKAEEAEAAAAKAAAAKAAEKGLAAQKLEAEKKAQEMEKRATENEKQYQEKKWKLNFKISFIIEQIEGLNPDLAARLKNNEEGAIGELISTIEEGAEPIDKLKLKLANCLKELGSMMNLRESKQILRIKEYIDKLKQANDIFKINQYLTEDNKLDDIDLEDKICQMDDNTETCKKKLEEALDMFERFKGKMTKALGSQNENETKFKKMKDDGEKFKTEFGKWMEGLNELENDPIEKLNGLKDTIQRYQINDELLGDEKDLKRNMVKEIEILIKTITEFKQHEEELEAEKKNMEQAQINLDAAKAAETSAQVEAAAKKVEEAQKDKELEEFGLGETGTDVVQQQVQKDKDGDGDGQPVVAKTDESVEEVDTSAKTVESGTPSVESGTPSVEEVVADVAVDDKETEAEKTARLAKEKLKEARLPESPKLAKSLSEGDNKDPKKTPLKRSDTAPTETPIMPEGQVAKNVQAREETIAQNIVEETETDAQRPERLKIEEKRKDATQELAKSLPQVSPTAMSKKADLSVKAQNPTYEQPVETIGGGNAGTVAPPSSLQWNEQRGSNPYQPSGDGSSYRGGKSRESQKGGKKKSRRRNKSKRRKKSKKNRI
ncbi:hypothetical protein OAA99_02650 [Omnitrophica bacterium]|nr:hypothetical protein [Candidatus Omnitrophota bacterium]